VTADRPSLFDPPADPPADPLLARWTAVDSYLVDTLAPPDPALAAALDASDAADLPPLQVTPGQGKLLQLLGLAVGARRILEIGTLGGYSTIWLARALPPDGELVTLEIEPRHAGVAQANVDRAGLGDRVDIRIGPALAGLAALRREAGAPFDLVFVDADAERCAEYVDHAVALAHRGSVIVVDDTVRGGAVADESATDDRVLGVRRLHDALAADPRVEATALQTVGRRGWDGFTLAVVVG
jgi:predicted O-methyltransferase YrrM